MFKNFDWSMILKLPSSVGGRVISPFREGFIFAELQIRENKTSRKFLKYQLSNFEECSCYNL